MPPQHCELGKVLPLKVIPARSLSPVLTFYFKLDLFPDQAVPPVRDRVSRGWCLGDGKGRAAHGYGKPGSTGPSGKFTTVSTARVRQGEAITPLQLAVVVGEGGRDLGPTSDCTLSCIPRPSWLQPPCSVHHSYGSSSWSKLSMREGGGVCPPWHKPLKCLWKISRKNTD